MSLFLSVLSSVAPTVQAVATTTPMPTPLPVVVQVVPDWIKQTAELGLFLVPGYFASFLHGLADAKIGLTSWANAVVLFVYSIVLGLLGLVAAGQFDLAKINLHNPEQVGTAILAVLGAAAARYAVVKAKASKDEPSVAPAASTEVSAQF